MSFDSATLEFYCISSVICTVRDVTQDSFILLDRIIFKLNLRASANSNIQ